MKRIEAEKRRERREVERREEIYADPVMQEAMQHMAKIQEKRLKEETKRK